MNLKSIKFPGLDGEYTIPQTAEDVGATNMKLLWENASIASSFSEQTISLDLTGYDMIYVVFRHHKSSDVEIEASCLVGSRTRGLSVVGWAYVRDFTVSTSGVVFKNSIAYQTYGDANSQYTNNDTLVPYKIYGIKGVTK